MTDISWKDVVRNRLTERIYRETGPFEEVFQSYHRLFEKVDSLANQNTQLRGENERLRQENIELSVKAQNGGSMGNGHLLEQKLFKLQEELTELHRMKGNTAEEIMNLNKTVQEKDKVLMAKDSKIAELEAQITSLKQSLKRANEDIQEVKKTHDLLMDECGANSLAYAALEEKYRKTKMENEELLKRWMEHKGKMADKINEENEKVFKENRDKLRRQLEDAAKEPVNLQDPGGSHVPVCFGSVLPSKLCSKTEAHDSEVNCVRWSPSGDCCASAGSDRKVKLWAPVGNALIQRGILTGSNAGVMAIDFDQEATLLIGASSDFATRIWTLGDLRLRHTLTGHASKVMAARFFGDSGRVVTGSLDRTMKIWDLRSRACVKTVFAGSAYHDLVACASPSSLIVSGHFDKKIRFWDTRSTDTNSTSEIALGDRITGLSLSPDQCSLLVCSRDDSLRTLDLRMSRVCNTYQDDRFRVGYDYNRPTFSPDGQYVACGGSDGVLYVWNTSTSRVEKRIKDNTSGIVCCHWHPAGTHILACDRQKKVFLFASDL